MHHEVSDMLNHNKVSESLSLIGEELNLSSAEISSLMKISKSSYLYCLNKKKDFPAFSLLNITDKFNVAMESLYSGQFDMGAIKAYYAGDKDYIPEKYRIAPYSKKLTVLNYLSYLEQYHNSSICDQVMRKLQFTDDSLHSEEFDINITVFVDLLKILRSFGLGKKHFYEVGQHFFELNKDLFIGKVLSLEKSTKRVYECLFEDLIVLQEKNYRYEIMTSCSDHFVVKCTPYEEIVELLGTENVGSQDVCAYKRGFGSILPKFIGNELSVVEESKCIYRGDNFCQFDISFVNQNH